MYMGLDLSLTSTGISIFDKDINLVYVDRIIPPKMTKEEKSDSELKDIIRISNICNSIKDLIVNYDIKFVKIEGQFFQTNARTVKQLSKLMGAVEFILYSNNVCFKVTAPKEIRLDVSGYGDLTKEENYMLIIDNLGHLDIVRKLGQFNDKNNKDKNSDKYDAITIIASELVKEGKIKWTISKRLMNTIMERQKKQTQKKISEKQKKQALKKKII